MLKKSYAAVDERVVAARAVVDIHRHVAQRGDFSGQFGKPRVVLSNGVREQTPGVVGGGGEQTVRSRSLLSRAWMELGGTWLHCDLGRVN